VEDAERAQRDPSTRLALALAEGDQQLIVMGMLQGPAAVGIALRLNEADRLGDPFIWCNARFPQVVEPVEDVVVPSISGTRT
jgi:hypothetical protein